MPNIIHVELSDTFNKQRQTINQLIDYANSNPSIIPGDGLSKQSSGLMAVKTLGDGLSFDASGNLVANDAYPNLLTQVVFNKTTPVPTPTSITSTTITFPAFEVIFDDQVYYGKKISDFNKVSVPTTTMTVDTGEDGAVFVYVDNQGEIHQSLNKITPGNSSTQCLLGSYFRLNNQIQSGSWAYTPWNGSTSKDTRFMGNGSLSGGLLRAATSSTLSRGAISVIVEGVNASTSIYMPNYKEYAAESTYITKKLWPGYDASEAETSTLDTTHIYNITDQTVDDISGTAGFVVLIPGIVAATGQDVYLMAMSPKSGGTYSQIFSSVKDAEAAIYGLDVSLGNVASRVVWLGISIIAEIGASDYTDKNQLVLSPVIPNALGLYGNASGSGEGSRIAGLTVKSNGVVVGEEEKKTTLDFRDGLTVLNTSENDAAIYVNFGVASQADVNAGTNAEDFVTPATLKNQNYLATVEYVGKVLQSTTYNQWPSSTNVNAWPHTLVVTVNNNYSIPNVQPEYTDKVLTWEVVIKNINNSSIALTWPASYQAFNNESLPAYIEANTSVFFMMRKYSNNFTLVSTQGVQSNTIF